MRRLVYTIQTDETSSSIVCPSSNFDEFFRDFWDNENIQRAFTKIPLTVRYIKADAEPEPMQVIRLREYDQIKFPFFLREKTSKAHFRIVELSDRQAKVEVSIPDTDWLTYYFFNMDTCWKLVFVDDHSL